MDLTLLSFNIKVFEFKFFTVALSPQRPYGLLRAESPGRSPRLSHSSFAPRTLLFQFQWNSSSVVLRSQRPSKGLLRTCVEVEAAVRDSLVQDGCFDFHRAPAL